MIPSDFIHKSFNMDWEPAESYGMDVDENIPAETPYFSTQLEEPYSPDVYMASTTVEEVYMSSPILTSPPLSLPLQIDRKSTFFLPPLNLNTKPIVFPPLNIHAFSLLTLKDRVGSSEVKPVPPHSSSEIYMPAALPEPPTPSNTRGMDQDPRPLSLNSDCRPTSKSGTALQGVSPILTLVMSVHNPEPLLDILEESLQVGDIRTAALDIPIKSIGSSEGPDETLGNDITPSDGKLFLESATPPGWPDWIVDQDITPSTPHPVFAETDTPGSSNRTVDEDPAPNSQYPNLETSTAFHSPQATNSQVYIDCGVDLIGLFSPNPDSPNLSEDDPVLRAFGGSRLEDLDWIHEGFRVTNFPDTCIEPYDWAVVSETSPDLISFNSAYDLGHRSVETSLVLATTHSGSFKLSSGDAIQSQSNLFRTSTPAPCDISSLVAEPTLDNMVFDSTPEIVIDTYDSQSFLSYYPASDIPEIPDISNVLSCSPFNSIYFQASALDDISKAAYTFERNARRNVELFKKKLSIEVQKLRVRTKTSTKFLASQDIQTTTHAGPKIDVKHDVFGEIAEVTDKSSARSTKKDASTQTQKLPDAAYSLRRPRRYSPYARYSPYRKLGRDFTFDSSDSVDLKYTPLKSHGTVTSGISCGSPSPVFIDCSIRGRIISEHEKETGLAIRDNSGELEEDDQEEMAVPGAYPIGQADDLLILEESIFEHEFETGLAVRNNSREPEEDDQEKEMSMPGAYPIEWVIYGPANTEKTLRSTVHYSLKERLFASLFDW